MPYDSTPPPTGGAGLAFGGASGGGKSGEGAGGTPGAACDGKPTGLYRETDVLEGGDCGPQAAALVDVGLGHYSAGTWPADCAGAASATTDGCGFEAAVSCPQARGPAEDLYCRQYGCKGTPTLTIKSKVTWAPGWASAIGTVDVTISGHEGGGNCHGLYGVAMTLP